MPKSLIEAHNIYKSYHQGGVEIKVLKNFSIQLLEGDFLAITGQSGSGKTTLLNILGLIDNFDSGSLNYLGINVLNMSEIDKDKARMTNLGFVYQSNNLFDDFTAKENVALPLLLSGVTKKLAFKKSEHCLAQFDLLSRCNHIPKDLSAGEQQRVAIARAVISKPNIIIADEPTGNLDIDTSRSVFDYFMRYTKENNCAVVMATHNEELAKLANKRIIIGDNDE